MAGGNIFISYRRDDSGGYARAIFDQFVKRFSKDRVFMDVESIEPGLAFDKAIDQAVAKCEVLLVLIGKRWLDPVAPMGPRINDPKDFVRAEISAALTRNIRVIPVLLEGANMPPEELLPANLHPLARRNAIEISSSRFAFDVDRLTDTVAKALGDRPDRYSPASTRTRRWLMYSAAGGLGTVGALFTLPYVSSLIRRDSARTDHNQADWRFCSKCQSLFFDGYSSKGICSAGGAHHAMGLNFVPNPPLSLPNHPSHGEAQGRTSHPKACSNRCRQRLADDNQPPEATRIRHRSARVGEWQT